MADIVARHAMLAVIKVLTDLYITREVGTREERRVPQQNYQSE